MCQNPLLDASFCNWLLVVDRDLASEAQAAGCPVCDAPVHVSNYERKPAGGPSGLGGDFCNRFSFCCAADGCRKRLTPASVRFLGRRRYLGAVVVLAAAARQCLSTTRDEQLHEWLDVSRDTVRRWLHWWRTQFSTSPFWQVARARLATPILPAQLPLALVETFVGEAANRLQACLRFLTPISSPGARRNLAF